MAEPNKSPEVAVVGGGAAGILAAISAAEAGARTVLFEKTGRIGTKILISGGGKCNITHDCSVEGLLSAFRENERRFLRPAAYAFTKDHILQRLQAQGVEVYTRPDGRVFPSNTDAKGVVAALQAMLKESGAKAVTNASVTGIEVGDGSLQLRLGDGQAIPAKSIIIATGGLSYPNTGSTGDAWKWLRYLGHTIVQPRAALAPMEVDLPAQDRWAGVAIRDCQLIARQGAKAIAKQRGDLLFTHRGLSGPACLEISRQAAEALEPGPVMISVNLLPGKTPEQVSDLILSWREDQSRRSTLNAVQTVVPDRLAPALLAQARLAQTTPCHQMTREDRNRLGEVLREWALGSIVSIPIEKGEVTAGGVSLDEVDSKTMESRRKPGLYVAGEALDLAGPVGGYNLQAAFSTGWLAGKCAAGNLTRREDQVDPPG